MPDELYKPGTEEKTESPTPAKEKAKVVSNQLVAAMELPFVLVSAVVIGGLLGYLLDRRLHTKPLFMFILGGLGFVAGVRDLLRRLPGNNDGTKGA
jgi:F0F1-type ATP synthase assembly protein I